MSRGSYILVGTYACDERRASVAGQVRAWVSRLRSDGWGHVAERELCEFVEQAIIDDACVTFRQVVGLLEEEMQVRNA